MSRQDTLFAPAPRIAPRDLQLQSRLLAGDKRLARTLDALSSPVLILNEQRQIVHANRAGLAMLDGAELDAVLGLRPGEALLCRNLDACREGCGTGEACRSCGAVLAILSALDGEESTQECRVSRLDGGCLDLRVTAHSLELEGETFVLFSVLDIADEKRRDILERSFFHDVINSAGGILGAATLLQDGAGDEDPADLARMIGESASELINELRSHRELMAAERGDLTLSPGEVDLDQLLDDLGQLYVRHPVAEGRSLGIMPCGCGYSIYTDRTLLFRILGNMVKNALEASPAGEEVTLGCERWGDGARLWVRNEGVMDREVQPQVFHRSFSTKGKGRGLGTYSMRLLGERYLGGQVSFSSSPERGTVFWIELPAILVPSQ